MRKRNFSFVVYTIIGLAIIGMIAQLITNPTSLFRHLLTILVIGLIIFGVAFFVFSKLTQSNEMKKYNQAVKQSKSKYPYQYHGPRPIHTINHKTVKKNKKSKPRPTHLRVIEGNKSKRKNRATF